MYSLLFCDSFDSVAMATKENLMSQRGTLKKISTTMNTMASILFYLSDDTDIKTIFCLDSEYNNYNAIVVNIMNHPGIRYNKNKK